MSTNTPFQLTFLHFVRRRIRFCPNWHPFLITRKWVAIAIFQVWSIILAIKDTTRRAKHPCIVDPSQRYLAVIDAIPFEPGPRDRVSANDCVSYSEVTSRHEKKSFRMFSSWVDGNAEMPINTLLVPIWSSLNMKERFSYTVSLCWMRHRTNRSRQSWNANRTNGYILIHNENDKHFRTSPAWNLWWFLCDDSDTVILTYTELSDSLTFCP